MVKYLLAHGADPNMAQNGLFRPLHEAAANGDREIVDLLLKAGADRRAKTSGGKTPADLATEKGHQELAALLR
jgi:ankyrin repeat protein